MIHSKTSRVFLVAILVSILIPFLTIVLVNSFPFFGLGLSFILLSCLIYFTKTKKNRRVKIFFLFTLLFSSLVFVRSEILITFLNIVSTIFFGSLMIQPKLADNLVQTLFSPVFVLTKSFFTKSQYGLEKSQPPVSKNRIVEILGGIFISALVLALILPLLASTNPIFNKLLLSLVEILNLKSLLGLVSTQNLLVNIVRLCVAVFLSILIPKMITTSNEKSETSEFNLLVNLFIPKVVTSLVLFIFFVTQLQLYFSTGESLAQMGYSLSEYTREVFGQLSVVTLIIFSLFYFDKSQNKYNKILTYILLAQAFFLSLMAGKSVYEYSDKWGFTYKRLYGFSVFFWMLGTLWLFIKNFQNGTKKGFSSKLIVWTGIVLMGINLANFDYLIYHMRKSTTGQGIDYKYLASLSSDSLSFRDQIDTQVSLSPDNLDTKEKVDEYNRITEGNPYLFYKARILANKYRKFDIRTFNFLEFLQYKQIENLDLEYYRILLIKPVPFNSQVQ